MEERQECPERCQRGYCVPFGVVVIPAGVTTFTTNATNTISRPFMMQHTEVTRQVYQVLLNDDPSVLTTSPLLPVNNVAWLDAVGYANLLSAQQRLDFCYTAGGLPLFAPIADCPGWRLPTLQEFFHAYRAQTDTFFYCGDEAECLTNTAHCGPESNYSEVRQLLPNPWGLYDIAGNVGEWTHDLHGPQPPTDVVDWDGPSRGEERYLAGGNAGESASSCSSLSRHVRAPEEAGVEAGFRLVRTLHPE
jgi:formylglycine-generating enzyme required for sulfatase activity